ncbi:uncharacterized protein LOC120135148 [Hibiscus syriacus]|uniref:uncharacterized protein LOC120135148 n=1 Tax=Hibiscus syriacus TaxID=106335 RepID=UPI0019238F8C|nr:uncharacterized protein LOC120135148 [Hibiscus syriacus]
MSIVAWMAILNKLPTKDRLINMGMKLDGLCDLCNAELEDRDNLFNNCAFVSGIWRKILQTCKIPHRNLCWSDSLDWAAVNFRGKSLLVSILKLAWISLLYFVWEESNFRRFRGCSRSADIIFKSIRRYVGDRISAILTRLTVLISIFAWNGTLASSGGCFNVVDCLVVLSL